MSTERLHTYMMREEKKQLVWGMYGVVIGEKAEEGDTDRGKREGGAEEEGLNGRRDLANGSRGIEKRSDEIQTEGARQTEGGYEEDNEKTEHGG